MKSYWSFIIVITSLFFTLNILHINGEDGSESYEDKRTMRENIFHDVSKHYPHLNRKQRKEYTQQLLQQARAHKKMRMTLEYQIIKPYLQRPDTRQPFYSQTLGVKEKEISPKFVEQPKNELYYVPDTQEGELLKPIEQLQPPVQRIDKQAQTFKGGHELKLPLQSHNEEQPMEQQEKKTVVSKTARTGTAKPRMTKPRSAKPRSAKPRSAKPRSAKPQSTESQSVKLRSTKPRSAKPRTVQPKSANSKPRKTSKKATVQMETVTVAAN